MTRIDLPTGAQPPVDVFVNGVQQREGEDYELVPGAVVFRRTLVKEGKIGTWNPEPVLSYAGIARTYNDLAEQLLAFSHS